MSWLFQIRLVLGILMCGALLPCFAQGTIGVRNLGNLVNAPIFLPDCITPVSGLGFRAALYAGPAGSLEPALVLIADSVTPFLTRASGYFDGGVRPIPGVPAGAMAVLQVRVWATAAGSYEAAAAGGGLYGKSDLFELGLGHGTFGPPPPALIGLKSFCLVPEPSNIALAVIGGLCLLASCWNRSYKNLS